MKLLQLQEARYDGAPNTSWFVEGEADIANTDNFDNKILVGPFRSKKEADEFVDMFLDKSHEDANAYLANAYSITSPEEIIKHYIS